MKKWIFLCILAVMGFVAVYGINPFAPYRNITGVLAQDAAAFETGISRQSNGVYQVRAFTEMPGVRPEMVAWWFGDYMQTIEHYKRWHPAAHVWMDWENKEPGRFIGASHLVHEYLGDDLHKLRIQFVEPTQFLPNWNDSQDRVAVCARAGALDDPMNFTTMCHLVYAVPEGAEMRSVFWMGHVSKREGNNEVASLEGMIGNTWLARRLLLTDQFANDLKVHALEEMSILAGFLPDLYAKEVERIDSAESSSPA